MVTKAPPIPKIKYVYSNDYTVHPVTGASVGTGPGNDSILVQFFLDAVVMPEEVELVPVEDQPGVYREPEGGVQTGVIQRTMNAGVFMSPQQAMNLATALMTHAQTILQGRKEVPNA